MDRSVYMMNGVGMVLILLMLFNFGAKSLRRRENDDRLFTAMLLLNLAVLVMDSFSWWIDGKVFPGAEILAMINMQIYYILHPIICFCFLIYCNYQLTGRFINSKRWFWLFSIPVFFAVVVSMINYVKPLLFYYDEDNVYQRGPLFIIFTVVMFVYFVYIAFVALRELHNEKRKLRKEDIRIILFYQMIPLVCTIVQAFSYGVALIWIGSAIAFLIVYFNLQNVQILIDPLTNLNNRRKFEGYFDYITQAKRSKNILFLLMIDVNYFKNINDSFGHQVGDQALKKTADLLLESIACTDFVARMGGDEFGIVGERNTEQEVLNAVEQVKACFTQYNSVKDQPYQLSVSIGLAKRQKGEALTADDLLRIADEQMYCNKRAYHACNQPT